MLLSIDRVLQLLQEDKSLDRIAALANCQKSDVVAIIQEARRLIDKYEKPTGRKKIIIKNLEPSESGTGSDATDADSISELLSGVELSAFPVGSSLIIYINAAIEQDSNQTGIGILVYDREGHQLAKVSLAVGRASIMHALYIALIKSLKLAAYFKTRSLRIRTDSEHMVRQIDGSRPVKNDKLKSMHAAALHSIQAIPDFRMEHATYALTDKADFLAHKASERYKK